MNYKKLIPVFLCFFVMGFVDLTGAATNYIKADLQLNDTMANIIPSMVFFWFLIFSIPSSLLMNKIGRKKTVLVSLAITLLSLLMPLLGNNYWLMLTAFAFLGIGNTIMQTSLNPLVSNIITGNRLASSLTLGQFVKAIASFIAPIIASWGTVTFLGWKMLFPVFAIINVLAFCALYFTPIQEEPVAKPAGFAGCLRLLGNIPVLLLFLGIMCHVGVDVGTNVAAPKLLIERAGLPTNEATFASSVYFLFRTIGCLSGSFLLARFSVRKFFTVSVVMMLAGMAGLFFVNDVMAMYVCIALIGFGNSNVFSIIFAQALNTVPDNKNEVSGLMIMGLFGGTLFPLCMGLTSDAMGTQTGSVIVMMIGVVYLLLLIAKIKHQ